MNNNLLIFFAEIVFKHFQKIHFQKESPYFHSSFTNRKKRQTAFLAYDDGRHGIRTHARFYTPTAFPTQPLKPLE